MQMPERFTNRQLAAGTAAGMTAIGAWRLAGLPWLAAWLGLGGAAIILYSIRHGGTAAQITAAFGLWPARVLLTLEGLWLAVVLGWLAVRSADAFPGQDMFPTVGLVLLALVLGAVRRGGGVMARCGAVCFLVLAALYTGVLAFAVPDLKIARLLPTRIEGAGIAKALAWCLLPAVGLLAAPQADERVRGPIGWGAAYLLAVPVMTTAALGAAVTAAVDEPFYIMVQNISILGVMERFEGVVSALEQVGAFCLMGVLAAAGGWGLADVWKTETEKGFCTALPLLAIPVMWLGEETAEAVVLAGSLAFCGILPVLALLTAKIKSSQNS